MKSREKVMKKEMKNNRMIITNISWCDDMGDRLTSNGLPDTVEFPLKSLPISYVKIDRNTMYASPETVSDAVWKYLFDRFGAVSDGHDFKVV